MVSGQWLTSEMRHLLFNVSQAMLRGNVKKVKIRGSNFEGKVRLKSEAIFLGAIYGRYFRAIIESEAGKANVFYIVCPGNLLAEDCHWREIGTNDFEFEEEMSFDPRMN